MLKAKRDYGSFNVTKRRNSWRAVVRTGVDPVTGDRPRKVFTAKTKTEAVAKATESFGFLKQPNIYLVF